MPFIAIALVIAAALGGGTAAIAQNSLPGDPLWGFKVDVNEGVAGALSASNDAKANWDLTTIKTRLNEAQQLSAKGKLNAQAQADIASNIKGHAESINTAITNLAAAGDTQDAADIAAQYQAELAAAPSINADATASPEADANNTTSLSATVRNAFEEASSLSASVNAAVK